MPFASCVRTRVHLFGVLAALLFSILASSALAQAPDPAPSPPAAAPLTSAEIEAVLATLTNDAEREKLVAQLRAVAEARRAVEPAAVARPFGARILDRLSEQLARLGGQVVAVGNYAVDVPDAWEWTEAQFSDPQRRERWAEILLKGIAALAAGILVEAVVRRLLLRPRRAVESRETERPLVRFVLLLIRTVLDMVPVLAFAAAAYAVLPFMDMDRQSRLAVLAIVNANVMVRISIGLARMALSPEVPSLRFVGVSDAAASYIFARIKTLTAIGIYGYFFIRILYILGVSSAAYIVLLKLLGIVIAVWLIVLILRNRTWVADKLRGRGADESGHRTLRSRLADLWHVLAITYVVAICGVWIMQVDEGFTYLFRATLLSIAVLVAARIATTLARQALRRGFTVGPDLQQAFPSLQQHADRYLSVLGYVLTGVIWAGAAAGLLWAWNVPLSRVAGPEVFGAGLRIGLVIGVAIAAWELLRAALARALRRAAAQGGLGQPSARARTLVPLLEKFVLIVITIVVGLMVLAEIGVDIAPLLAGAGIIGIAFGFGAQSLVKDVITGLFILIEDQFAVGDVITAAGSTGTVEDISLRTIRLRTEDGTLHIIPYSEVGSTANLSKGYSQYIFNIGVAYREDIDQVMAALRTLGEEITRDPAYAGDILGPFQVAGVNELADSAVVIKCTIKTTTGAKWKIGREVNRRIKKRFDELGIEMPYPHRTIYFGVDKQGAAPPVHVATSPQLETEPAARRADGEPRSAH